MSEEKPPLPEQRAYRTQYEAFFAPLGRKVAKLGITANTVSYLNLLFSILTTVAFYYSSNNQYLWLYVALIFITIASFFDMIDGSVARATKELYPEKKNGKFGAVLDPAIDRYSEAFIVLGLMLSGYVPPDWVLFAFVGMIMASYVRARAESLGMTSCSVGIERKEKITILSLGTGIQAVIIHLSSLGVLNSASFEINFLGPIPIGFMALGVLLVGILSHIATFQRLHLASKYL